MPQDIEPTSDFFQIRFVFLPVLLVHGLVLQELDEVFPVEGPRGLLVCLIPTPLGRRDVGVLGNKIKHILYYYLCRYIDTDI